MKSWMKKSDIEIYSTNHERKSVLLKYLLDDILINIIIHIMEQLKSLLL